jgi:3-hydroxybutyryl-CoA dehydratase
VTGPRALPPGHYGLDRLEPGDWIETGSATVSDDMIDQFAALTGDRFEIHMSVEGAARHGFPARVAHGLLVLSLIDGLKNQAPAQIRALASLGWDWSFRRPVFAGDTIRAVLRVEAKRATRTAGRGILSIAVEGMNQNGEVIQRGTNRLMAYR